MDLDGYIRFIVALIFVLGLIGLLTWLVRKLGIGGKVASAGMKAGGRGARLGVVEAATLDGRRKLVLIRRDGREHLVILGANGETVVERGIEPPPEALAEDGEAPKTDFRSILGGLGGTAPAPAYDEPASHEIEPVAGTGPDPAPAASAKLAKSAKPVNPAKSRAARRSQRAAARKAS